jgi:hypothetical protein
MADCPVVAEFPGKIIIISGKKMRLPFKLLIITIMLLSIFSGSCSDATSPLNFDQMNVVYTKSGGWIQTSKINVTKDGLTLFYKFIGPVDSTVKDSTYLNQSEKNQLSQMFESFNSYKRYYQPAQYWTDQNYHVIVLNYEGQSDTVSVYDPAHCELPGNLKKIIDFFESKIDFFTERNS